MPAGSEDNTKQWPVGGKNKITNTVHILTSGKVLFHLLYDDNNNKQTGFNYTEYIQNETIRSGNM